MNPLDRLYRRFSKEDKSDPLKALATEVVNNRQSLEELEEGEKTKVREIIRNRKRAIDQTIMWS